MTWQYVSTFKIDSSYRFRWQAMNAIKKLQQANPTEKYYIMEKANPKQDDRDRYNVCFDRRAFA